MGRVSEGGASLGRGSAPRELAPLLKRERGDALAGSRLRCAELIELVLRVCKGKLHLCDKRGCTRAG